MCDPWMTCFFGVFCFVFFAFLNFLSLLLLPIFSSTAPALHPPDCVKGGYDHVAGVDVSWKGGVGVEDVLPLRPLCLVVDHLAQP